MSETIANSISARRAVAGSMKVLLAAALLPLLTSPVLAQEDRHILALKAVELGFEPQMTDRIMETYWPAATELIKLRVPGLTEVQLFQYKGKTQAFAAEAAHATLMPMVELLERGFSEDELKALIAFYESPAGIKLNGAAPIINATMSGAVTEKLAGEIASFQDKIDQMLTADGH